MVIWSPDDVQQPKRGTGTNSPASTPLSQQNLPAIIKDESDNNIVPLTPLRRSPRAHTAPLTTNAHTRLYARTAHMINCVIAKHTLTAAQLPPPSTTTPARRHGYALPVHLLHHNEQHSAEITSEHFIGAVLDNDTGAVLEYQHLIKSEK